MALTNFGRLTDNQMLVWSRDFWHEARNRSLIMSFAGTSANSMIHRITELSDTNDGARAVLTLINEAQGDGVVGDNQLDGNEEALSQDDQIIRVDMWRHAHRSEGRMAEQTSIVKFRENARDQLAARLADILDQLAFLTLSGVSYAFKVDGTSRSGSQLPNLTFASDVSTPSSRRYYRWDATNGLTSSPSTADLVAADTPSWAMLQALKAKAVNEYIRPLRSDDGVEGYNVFMTPDGMAALKRDADFKNAMQYAAARGGDNPLFKGTKHGGKQGIFIDGLNILEYRHVYHSSTWGGGSVAGQAVLLCGAQALACADIGDAFWDEDKQDYNNRLGISVGKKFGLLKPKFYSTYASSDQDYGVIRCDTAV